MQIAAYNLREKPEIFAAIDMTSWTQFITEDSASELKQCYDAFGEFSPERIIYINKARIRRKLTE